MPFRSGLPQIRLTILLREIKVNHTTLLREIKVNHMVLKLGWQFPINISSIKTGCFHNKFPGSCGSGRDDMIYSLPGRRVMPFFFFFFAFGLSLHKMVSLSLTACTVSFKHFNMTVKGPHMWSPPTPAASSCTTLGLAYYVLTH